MSYFLGMQIFESPLCELPEPNRKHIKRRGQSEAYHKRIQKKWTKRFGTHMVPAAFIFNPKLAAGLDMGETLLLHPSHMAMLRNLEAST